MSTKNKIILGFVIFGIILITIIGTLSYFLFYIPFQENRKLQDYFAEFNTDQKYEYNLNTFNENMNILFSLTELGERASDEDLNVLSNTDSFVQDLELSLSEFRKDLNAPDTPDDIESEVDVLKTETEQQEDFITNYKTDLEFMAEVLFEIDELQTELERIEVNNSEFNEENIDQIISDFEDSISQFEKSNATYRNKVENLETSEKGGELKNYVLETYDTQIPLQIDILNRTLDFIKDAAAIVQNPENFTLAELEELGVRETELQEDLSNVQELYNIYDFSTLDYLVEIQENYEEVFVNSSVIENVDEIQKFRRLNLE